MAPGCEVVIVGAGPAGSSLAIELARSGHAVLLLDQGRFPRDKVCGDYVSPRGLRLLAELGCHDAHADAEPTRIGSAIVYLDERELTHGAMPSVAGQPAFGRTIPRMRLDDALFQRARALGVKTVEGCRVTDVEVGSEGVRIAAELAGSSQQYFAEAVVGADGATSCVANRLGLTAGHPGNTMASLRAYGHGWAPEQSVFYVSREYFPGFGWIFPIGPGRCNLGVGMLKEPLVKHRLNLRAFFAQLTRFAERLARERGASLSVGYTNGWPIKVYGSTLRNSSERALLVGEAAGLVDPVSGEGIALALESGMLAAQTLHGALLAQDFSRTRLATYDTLTRERWDIDLKLSGLIVELTRNRYLTPLWLRCLKVTGMTASLDPAFALTTGGILAGATPGREAFTLDMLRKAVVHGPEFWRSVFDLPNIGPSAWLQGGLELVRWQSELLDQIVADADWFSDWALAVQRRQRELLTTWSNSDTNARVSNPRQQ